jgi:hypothetical protein
VYPDRVARGDATAPGEKIDLKAFERQRSAEGMIKTFDGSD